MNSIIGICLVLGTFFIVAAAVGVIRFPDVYTRSHASSKSATLGILFILLGVFIHFWHIDGDPNMRILLGIIFIFITGPIGGHMLMRAAYFSNIKPTDRTVRDDLAAEYKRKQQETK